MNENAIDNIVAALLQATKEHGLPKSFSPADLRAYGVTSAMQGHSVGKQFIGEIARQLNAEGFTAVFVNSRFFVSVAAGSPGGMGITTFSNYLTQLAEEDEIVIQQNAGIAPGATKLGWHIATQPSSKVDLTTSPDGREFRINARAGTYSIEDAEYIVKRLRYIGHIAEVLNKLLRAEPEL